MATSSTICSGNRTTPIATNTATRIKSPMASRRLNSGVTILKTTAISRPTAAQDTPANIRRNASISP